jgi:hypothetical protein
MVSLLFGLNVYLAVLVLGLGLHNMNLLERVVVVEPYHMVYLMPVIYLPLLIFMWVGEVLVVVQLKGVKQRVLMVLWAMILMSN